MKGDARQRGLYKEEIGGSSYGYAHSYLLGVHTYHTPNENRHCTSRGSVATISARVAAGGRRKGRRRGIDRAEREIHGSFFRGDTIELKLL